MAVELDNRIKQANDRLKSAKLGVTIGAAGSRLWLRATLPAKPGSDRGPYQQRIYTGYSANAKGLKAAEIAAKRLGSQLSDKSFDWTDWGHRADVDKLTIAEWVERFEKDWWETRPRSETSKYTLERAYLRHFRKLEQDIKLDEDAIVPIVLSSEADSRTRLELVRAYGRLAKFANVEIDLSRYKGNYSPARVLPRDLPSDREIAEIRDSIKEPWWQWCYGLMAAYGLRNHEVFHVDLSDYPKLRIGEGTKTGYRVITPLYPEWALLWKLNHVPDYNFSPEDIAAAGNSKLGYKITQGFLRRGIKKPYNLRHCYARRCRDFLVPVTLAARLMGHSATVHEEIYSRWISEADDDRLLESLIARPDRPKINPPEC